mmetsp:Transcript_14875/g.32129  ORF Transcript_14875/g.32129 Transcript_14875/m.32129 type:complete len:86 (+) Transcript_14875:1436-1693(+)
MDYEAANYCATLEHSFSKAAPSLPYLRSPSRASACVLSVCVFHGSSINSLHLPAFFSLGGKVEAFRTQEEFLVKALLHWCLSRCQ